MPPKHLIDQDQCQLAPRMNHYGYSKVALGKGGRSVSAMKKYTVYFFKSPNTRSFANPSQEFSSLDEARIFAQNAAETALVEIAHSFRIQSEDGSVNEHWSRRSGGWKLEA